MIHPRVDAQHRIVPTLFVMKLAMHNAQVTRCQPGTAQFPRPPSRRRAGLRGSGGGLFGGLFGGKQQQQQQEQQQQQSVSQPSAQPVPAAAGTTDNPEFPPYQVLQKGTAYDLRFYEVYPVVEMDYQRREEGYLALGSYQDGANSSSSRHGHTQPVVMCYHPDGRKVMQMMVGTPKAAQQQDSSSSRSSTITTLPAPTDPAVRLAVSGGEVVAVMPFEGYITPEAAASVRQQLAKALEKDGLSLAADEAEGFFRVAQYGQVYTLQTRLNEMMLKVQL